MVVKKSIPCIICGRGWEPGPKKKNEVTSSSTSALLSKFFQLFERHVSGDGGVTSGTTPGHMTVFEKLTNSGNVVCCGECSKIMVSFCELYHEMKAIELKVNWKVTKLEQLLGAGVELEKENSKEDEDVQTLQDLRRGLVKKCERKFRTSFPRLILDKCQPPQEESATTQGHNPGTSNEVAFEPGDPPPIDDVDVREESDAGHCLRSVHRCPKCRKTFSDPKRLVEHKRSHEEDDDWGIGIGEDDDESDVEDDCDYAGPLEDSEMDSEDSESCPTGIGGEKGKFKCSQCDKEYIRNYRLTIHRQRAHGEAIKEPITAEAEAGGRYPCSFCGKGFGRWFHFMRHLKTVHSNSIISLGKGQRDPEKSSEPLPLINGSEGAGGHDVENDTGTFEISMEASGSLGIESFSCPTCNTSFTQKCHLQRHGRKVKCQPVQGSSSTIAREEKCVLCGMGFGKVSLLRRHFLDVHNPRKSEEVANESESSTPTPKKPKSRLSSLNLANGRHKCSVCPDREFKSVDSFREHWQVFHLNLTHLCEICGKEFRHRKNYWQHRQVAHGPGGRRYKCIKCNKTFTQNGDLRRHERISSCAPEGNREEPLTTCHICGKQIKPMSLQKHLKSVHEKVREEICDLCGNKFANKGHLRRHRRDVHQLEAEEEGAGSNQAKPKSSNVAVPKGQYSMDSESGRYTCALCPAKQFKSVDYFQEHWRSVHLSLTFNCDLCPKTFRHRKGYWQHRRVFHGGHRYTCEKCGKTFTQNGGLRLHQRTTSCADGKAKESPVTCHLCGMQFTRKGNLQVHLKFVHDKVREYGCPQCSKKFSHLAKLQRHVKEVHEKLREHRCGECGKVFANNGHLKRHTQTVHAKADAADRSSRSSSGTADEET